MGKYGRKSVISLTVAIFRENMFWGLPTRLMKVLFNYMKKKRLPVPTHISSWALHTFLEIAQDSISCPCHARTHHYYAYLAQTIYASRRRTWKQGISSSRRKQQLSQDTRVRLKKFFGLAFHQRCQLVPRSQCTLQIQSTIYICCKIIFFIFKFGAAGLNQAKLADLWPEEGDFSEHVDRIWSVYYDWGTNWQLRWNSRHIF